MASHTLDELKNVGNSDPRTVLIDTNVLFWIFYDRSTSIKEYQKEEYPDIFANTVNENNYVVNTVILSELFNLIEKTEHELYRVDNNLPKEYSLKRYRKNSKERKKLKQRIELIYQQIHNAIEVRDCNVSTKSVVGYMDNMYSQRLDCNDYIVVEFCRENNINKILTDDSDYISLCREFQIYSANKAFFKNGI